jgi:hypothetical protein
MCVTPLGWAYGKKYVKGDVSICDRLKEKRVKEDWGHIDPHGTIAGLKQFCVLLCVQFKGNVVRLRRTVFL